MARENEEDILHTLIMQLLMIRHNPGLSGSSMLILELMS